MSSGVLNIVVNDMSSGDLNIVVNDISSGILNIVVKTVTDTNVGQNNILTKNLLMTSKTLQIQTYGTRVGGKIIRN